MLEEAKRTLAYVCPVCGKSVIMERTAFQLAATVNHLPCPCGKSELVIEMMGDQCHMLVPCVFCGKDHKVSCSTKALLHENGYDTLDHYAVVSSDYHLCRAAVYWELPYMVGVAARMPDQYQYSLLTVNYYIREAFALAAELPRFLNYCSNTLYYHFHYRS